LTCYIKKSALSPPLGRKVSDEFNVPLRRAIIARSIAVAMKPHGGKISALIRPSLPARFGWRRIRADNYGQNGQRSSKFYWVITQRRRLRCGSRADHGSRLRLGPAVEIIRNFNCGLHRAPPNWHKTVNPYLWKSPEIQAPDCGGSRSPHYSDARGRQSARGTRCLTLALLSFP